MSDQPSAPTPNSTSDATTASPNTGVPTDSNATTAAPKGRHYVEDLDAKAGALLVKIYLDRRLQLQKDYYEKSAQKYETNAETVFRINALILSVTTLLAALGADATGFPAELRLLTALLPAIATLVASLAQLHRWDEQSRLYRSSVLGIEKAKLVMPDEDVLDPDTALSLYPKLVEQAEKVFVDEINQWGQLIQDKTTDGKDVEDPLRKFALDYGLDILDENGNVDELKLGQYKDILQTLSPQSQKPKPKVALTGLTSNSTPSSSTSVAQPTGSSTGSSTPSSNPVPDIQTSPIVTPTNLTAPAYTPPSDNADNPDTASNQSQTPTSSAATTPTNSGTATNSTAGMASDAAAVNMVANSTASTATNTTPASGNMNTVAPASPTVASGNNSSSEDDFAEVPAQGQAVKPADANPHDDFATSTAASQQQDDFAEIVKN